MGDPAQIKDFEFIFNRILMFAAEIAVLIAFIMLVIGGFKYLTASGDAKSLDSAKGTITWAIFGLAGLIIIWLLLKLIEVFTGVPVTIFRIIP